MLGRYLDLGNPVSDHPLNRGLVAWWLGLPNNSGGGTLFDLCGRNPLALTNSPAWSPDRNTFGGTRLVRSSNQYATRASAVVSAVPFTVSMWCKLTNVSESQYLFEIGTSNAAFWSVNAQGAATSIRLVCNNNLVGTAAGTWTNGVWFNATAVFAANNDRRVYVNGGGKGTDANTVNVTPGAQTRIGSYPDTGPLGPDGTVSDVRVWNRALDDGEVFAAYEQGLRGNPDTLRRWSRKVSVFGGVASGGGGFQAAWAAGSNVVLQPGTF